jgi:hypothetical protein
MSLYDEDPRPTYRNDDSGPASQTAEVGEAARQKVQDWSAEAGKTAREAATKIADQTASMAGRATDVLSDAADAARDTFTEIAGVTREACFPRAARRDAVSE